ncbi:hypothetical protein J2Y41_003831 [Arthrobacter sp. 1088]|uniref:hypothetical protein n=1 Tax=Arthrobacter sp. 1088 TaxID=2817768 RepID=UPI00286563C8|nr:hypothetical protein [Arthrobacter sp. 1088]MDR6688245.1 hypothetical protein [Arthrobacter sp. 1088]
MTEISSAGIFGKATYPTFPSNEVIAVDQEGNLHNYYGITSGGLYGGDQIGTGWDIFNTLI